MKTQLLARSKVLGKHFQRGKCEKRKRTRSWQKFCGKPLKQSFQKLRKGAPRFFLGLYPRLRVALNSHKKFLTSLPKSPDLGRFDILKTGKNWKREISKISFTLNRTGQNFWQRELKETNLLLKLVKRWQKATESLLATSEKVSFYSLKWGKDNTDTS